MFTVKFITYKGEYKTLKADSLNFPTNEGRRVILSNHMPIVSTVDVGRLFVSYNDTKEEYVVDDGVILFENNQATVLVNDIKLPNEINIQEIDKLVEHEKEKVAAARKSNREDDLLRAQLALARAINKQKAARREN